MSTGDIRDSRSEQATLELDDQRHPEPVVARLRQLLQEFVDWVDVAQYEVEYENQAESDWTQEMLAKAKALLAETAA